jgi:hypothetical protein
VSGLGLTFLLLVCGFVWGGFIACLLRMMRSETQKSRSGGVS